MFAATFTGENAGTVHSTINVYELLGAEVFLYFDVAGTQVTARVGSGTEPEAGDKASFNHWTIEQDPYLRQRDRVDDFKLIV